MRVVVFVVALTCLPPLAAFAQDTRFGLGYELSDDVPGLVTEPLNILGGPRPTDLEPGTRIVQQSGAPFPSNARIYQTMEFINHQYDGGKAELSVIHPGANSAVQIEVQSIYEVLDRGFWTAVTPGLNALLEIIRDGVDQRARVRAMNRSSQSGPSRTVEAIVELSEDDPMVRVLHDGVVAYEIRHIGDNGYRGKIQLRYIALFDEVDTVDIEGALSRVSIPPEIVTAEQLTGDRKGVLLEMNMRHYSEVGMIVEDLETKALDIYIARDEDFYNELEQMIEDGMNKIF